MSFEKFIQERTYLKNVSPRTIEWYRQTFKAPMAGSSGKHAEFRV